MVFRHRPGKGMACESCATSLQAAATPGDLSVVVMRMNTDERYAFHFWPRKVVFTLGLLPVTLAVVAVWPVALLAADPPLGGSGARSGVANRVARDAE